MDYLDPRKQRTHAIQLSITYVVAALVILAATSILLRIAHGVGLGKNGQLVQNGFVFVSSQPGGAKVYVNNTLKATTSTRLQLPEGQYALDVERQGYNTWHRAISVHGDTVVRYDYPLLVPSSLVSVPLKTYATVPPLTLQSPDRRWLLVQQPGSLLNFDMYDLGSPKAVTSNITSITLPDGLLTDAGDQSWQLAEWSNDNRHVILQHNYAGGSEYILVDRTDPTKTENLTKVLKLAPGEVLSLRDKKFDQYYIFDPAAKRVMFIDLADPATETQVLTGALDFKSYGSDKLLYMTETGAQPGHVESMLRDGDTTYRIADHLAGAPYLLDLAQYSGDWFIDVGSSADNQVTVYKNPQSVRRAGQVLKPAWQLKVTAPNYLEISANTRFIMAENGQQFAVYDAEYAHGYAYTASQPLDAPQSHARWMDGDRVTYVSAGKQVMFDYDDTNAQTLAPSVPGLLPFFDRDYRDVYNLTPAAAATGQSIFMQTSLLVPKDQ